MANTFYKLLSGYEIPIIWKLAVFENLKKVSAIYTTWTDGDESSGQHHAC